MGLFRKKANEGEPPAEASEPPVEDLAPERDADGLANAPGDAPLADDRDAAPASADASAPGDEETTPGSTKPPLIDPAVHPPGEAPGPRGEPAAPRNLINDLLLTFITFGFWALHVAHRLDRDAIRHGGFREDPTNRYTLAGAAFFSGLVFGLGGASLALAPLFATLPSWAGLAALVLGSVGGALFATFIAMTALQVHAAARKANILQHWAGTPRLDAWMPTAAWLIPIGGPFVALWLLDSAYNAYWEAASEVARRWKKAEERREELATGVSGEEAKEEGKPKRRGTVVASVGLGPGAKSDPRNPIFRKRLVCPTCKTLNYVDPVRGAPTHVACTGCGTTADLELRLQIETRIV